ncbi:MAG TPA: PIG-L family deacetylase [Woeseiaceae bacterium]|nr:PIG-L family deacetylase [Woeseiaceae bacterium]
MIPLLTVAQDRPLRILCLGAHCDDIEIGCGATLRKLIARTHGAELAWHVFSSNPARAQEAERSATRFLEGAVASQVEIREFRNGYFPFNGAEIKDCFEALKSGPEPDIVFTHYGKDAHQDHRTISELTWNTFRNHQILEYEIAKYDGDLGAPNFFVPAGKADTDFKISTILQCFATQASKQWFDDRTFYALMRLRGIECNADSGYAEAFYARKTVFSGT